ncbi:hypothetical protein CMV_024526 [Castanea mollissima]|uniref:Uncharacterized protein n=1 Tax=Castanea mollissima TaxID=60419 RepID=A0A8J4VHW3_9ROSI|nr:hypothetical protein CMV_024526 [Castanea mollissima]
MASMIKTSKINLLICSPLVNIGCKVLSGDEIMRFEILNDTELPPFQPVFSTSYGFEPGLRGFLGGLNVSLSAPNNSELLALLPGPNMDHEVSNTVNDLRLLKGIHNDGCDSDERESEPLLFPDSTNGFDFGFAQPNLELGSSVSGGFHLGSSSMAHACQVILFNASGHHFIIGSYNFFAGTEIPKSFKFNHPNWPSVLLFIQLKHIVQNFSWAPFSTKLPGLVAVK